ncbi:tetratricopeptide repeat protein [Kitasatospora sp. NPDC097643]|uniref:tetratricopeptide repeat protein n=1 Tax=Kitasatospora sp. NPDC097643 TaxID=3157230 RepID=UPI00332C445B
MSNSITGGTFHGLTVQAENAQLTVAAQPPVVSGLPPLSATFTGRDRDLAELRALLLADGAGTVAVTGLGGIGKTTLAVAAGRAALEHGSFSLALFVNLRGYDETPMDAGQALDTLLRALGVPAEHIPPDPEARAALYRTRLEQREQPVLIVADNASRADQVRLLRPPSDRHRLLVTSRETLPSLGARLHRLDVLEPPAAVGLLAAAVRTARPDDERLAADPDSTRRIAALCGHLPLALRLAAAQLVLDEHLRPAELAEDLAETADRLTLLHDGDTGIRLTLDRSHRRLTPDQAELFRLLALNPGPDVSTEAVAALTDRRLRDVRRRLAQLAGTALIEQSQEGGRWYLHDLVQVYALEQAEQYPEEGSVAVGRLLAHYAFTANAANARVRGLPGDLGPRVFPDRADAVLWLERERINLVAVSKVAAAAGVHHVVLFLAPVLTSHLVGWFRTDDALAVAGAALEAARALGDRAEEAKAWNNLGLPLEHARRFEEAAEAHRQAGAIYRELGDGAGQARAYGNLGNNLRSLHRFEEAIEALEYAHTTSRDTGDRRGEALRSVNLGGLLCEVGRVDEGFDLLRHGRDLCRELGDRYSEATAEISLGGVLCGLWRFEEAMAAYECARSHFRDLGDRYGEARATGGLGTCLARSHRFEEALELHERTCATFRSLGDRHGEGVSRGDLGAVLEALDRGDEAADAYWQMVAAMRDTGDHEQEAWAWDSLGNVLHARGRFEEAVRAFENALAIDRERRNRRGEAGRLNNLAGVYDDLGRHQEAIDAFRSARRLFHECRDDFGEALARLNLGSALSNQGRYDEAAQPLRLAVTGFRELGDRTGEAVGWGRLAGALRGAGRGAEAAEADERARALLAEEQPAEP